MSDVLGGDRIDLTNEETLAKVDEETRNPTKKRRLSEADALRAAIGFDAVDAESGSSKRQSGRLAQVAAANEVNGLKAALSEADGDRFNDPADRSGAFDGALVQNTSRNG